MKRAGTRNMCFFLFGLTRCFLSAKVVEFNFSRNIMQTEYTAPTFCLYECNRFQMYF